MTKRGEPFSTGSASAAEINIEGLFGALRASSAPGEKANAKRFFKDAVDDEGKSISPRAQKYTASGEWERSDVILYLLDAAALQRMCCAEVGTPILGTSSQSSTSKFCAVPSSSVGGTCSATTHLKRMNIKPGIYISTSGSLLEGKYPKSGILSFPFLTIEPPVDVAVARALTDKNDPFTMSPAQFKYMFGEIEIYRLARQGLLHSPVDSQVKTEGGWIKSPIPKPAASPYTAVVPVARVPIDTGFNLADFEEHEEFLLSVEDTKAAAKQTQVEDDEESGFFDVTPPGELATEGEDPLTTLLRNRTPSEDQAVAVLKSLTKRIIALECGRKLDMSRSEEAQAEVERVNCLLIGRLQDLENANAALVKDALGFSVLLKRTLRSGQALGVRVAAIEAMVDGPAGAVNHYSEGELGSLDAVTARVVILEYAVLDPRGRVESIMQEVKNLEEKVEMGGVEFQEWQFPSQTEFLQWIHRHNPSHSELDYGLFLDAFSLLHGLDSGTLSQAEALKAEHDTKKVQYASALAARVSTAFATNFPDVFGTGGDLAGKTFGNNMSTHEKWSAPNGRTGLVRIIRERVPKSCVAIQNSISQKLMGLPEVHSLAREMLAASRDFVLDLTRFVDDFYSEMSLAPSMTTLEAWDLTRTLLAEVLTELRETRNTVEHSRDTEPLLTIWGALKTHEIMKRYKDKEFRDDPALTGILVRHILKRKTDSDGLESIRAKITTLTNRLTAAESTTKATQNEVRKKQDK
jgi:hypothetical protein